jgi:hypothetical protein
LEVLFTVAKTDAYITIRIEGPAVSAGRMRLDDFLRITAEFSTAAKRVALVLRDSKGSTRGRRSEELYESLSLDLVAFTEGSPAVVAHLERSLGPELVPDTDLGDNSYRALLRGLETLGWANAAWPEDFDVGVALAIKDMGGTFKRGVSRVSFTLNHRARPLTATLDRVKFAKIETRLAQPEPEITTIEGRLMMVDLKESRPKFRIDRPLGPPVICDFGDEMEFKISENLKAYVKVQGRAEYNSKKEITRFKVLSIERIGDGETEDLFSASSAARRFDPDIFWRSKSIDELTEDQGLRIAPKLEEFMGGWPESDLRDDFESAYLKWRQEDRSPVHE